MRVFVGIGARNPAMRGHMFVQSEQGGYQYCWIWYRLKGLNGQMVESVVSLAILYQFLCMIPISSLHLSE